MLLHLSFSNVTVVEDSQTRFPFPPPRRFPLNLLTKFSRWVAAPPWSCPLKARPGPLLLNSIARAQLQSLHRKPLCPHMAECLPVSMDWTFLHVGVSQVPWSGRALSSFPLLTCIQPLSPKSVLSVLRSPSVLNICTHSLSQLHTVPSSFLEGGRNPVSTLCRSYTEVLVRGSGRTSPPHIFTLYFWKSEPFDTITFRIYTLPSAKGFEVTELFGILKNFPHFLLNTSYIL